MRVLLSPLGSPGFLFPAIGLAHQLRQAGHEVAFVTAAWARGLLGAEGFDLVQGSPGFRTERWHSPAAVADQVRCLDVAIGEERPDLVVCSALALGPLLAAERQGLPVAVLGLLGPLWATEDPVWSARYGELCAAALGAREALGMHAEGPEHPYLGDLTLRPAVPLEGSVPEGVRSCRPILWAPRAGPRLQVWLEQLEQPPIYLQQGRAFGGPGFWDLAREALADLPVAAAVSRMDRAPGAVPPGWLVQPHVSMGPVLSGASAMVASGTSTTALGALRAGCPAVLLPSGGEQHQLAELLHELGVAEVLQVEGLTADGLRAAVLAASERRDAAQRAAAQLNSLEHHEPVLLLEALVDQLKPARRP